MGDSKLSEKKKKKKKTYEIAYIMTESVQRMLY